MDDLVSLNKVFKAYAPVWGESGVGGVELRDGLPKTTEFKLMSSTPPP